MASSPRRSSGARAPSSERLAEALDRALAAQLGRLLPGQRWFGSKGRAIAAVSVADRARLGERAWLALVDVAFDRGPGETYAMPFILREGPAAPGALSLTLEVDGGSWRADDAFDDPGFCLALLHAFERGTRVESARGLVRFVGADRRPRLAPWSALRPRRLAVEQSNTSVVYGDLLVLKALRRLEPGISLDYELGAFLTSRAGFAHVPPVAGAIEYVAAAGTVTTLAILQRYVPNRGDGWTYVVGHLGRGAAGDGLVADLRRLGAVTGGLHAALASAPADPAFAPEPITDADTAAWSDRIAGDVRRTCAVVRARLDAVPAEVRDEARALVAREAGLVARARGLDALAGDGCAKLRIHGDYHLGQTLRTDDGWTILDFEGEPARPLAERRRKRCALVDVAGMRRSFDYAVGVAPAAGRPAATAWAGAAAEAFLEGYLGEVAKAPARLVPRSRAGLDRALAVFELDKALYEIRYEIDHRPAWLAIPLRGLGRLLAGERGAP